MQQVAGWGMSSWSAGVWDNNRGSEDNIGNNGSSSSSKGRGVDSLTVAMIALGLGEGSLGQITGSTASNGGRVVKNRQAGKLQVTGGCHIPPVTSLGSPPGNMIH